MADAGTRTGDGASGAGVHGMQLMRYCAVMEEFLSHGEWSELESEAICSGVALMVQSTGR